MLKNPKKPTNVWYTKFWPREAGAEGSYTVLITNQLQLRREIQVNAIRVNQTWSHVTRVGMQGPSWALDGSRVLCRVKEASSIRVQGQIRPMGGSIGRN